MIKADAPAKTQRPIETPWWLLWCIPILALGVVIARLSPGELRTDWLKQEGGYLVSWWLLTSLAGMGVFPLLFRLLSGLPDRGYAVSRSAGLLLIGFLYWFMTSLTLTRNEPGTIVLAWVMVILFGAVAWLKWEQRPSGAELKAWFKDHLALFVITELLFVVLFFGWAYVRAHNPDAVSTEKPMEMMFINGIRNSDTFPPKDPWMAGYSISYYYFGYVLVAGLADISNVSTGVAFNLANALVFALAGTGALGLLYNLVRSEGALKQWRGGSRFAGIGIGLLGVVMLIWMGHLGTALVEMPYRGYAKNVDKNYQQVFNDDLINEDYFKFWDNKFRDEFVDRDADGIADWDDEKQELDQWSYWWWFAYGRSVQDRDFNGNNFGEVIVEFPNFSFILSDNHPHVIALAFAILTLNLIAGLALRRDNPAVWEIALYGILVGGMIFLNAWDASYLIIAVAADALRRIFMNGRGRLSGVGELAEILSFTKRRELNFYLFIPIFIVVFALTVLFPAGGLKEANLLIRLLLCALLTPIAIFLVNWMLGDSDLGGILRFGALLGVFTWLCYLPWILSFTSQANGIYPNILHPTRPQQFFLVFGTFLVLIGFYILLQFVRSWRQISWLTVGLVVIIGVGLNFAVPVLSTRYLSATCQPTPTEPTSREQRACDAQGSLFGRNVGTNQVVQNEDESDVAYQWRKAKHIFRFESEEIIDQVFERRRGVMPTHVFGFLVAGFVLARFFAKTSTERGFIQTYSPANGVVMLFIAAGLLIALAPDFFYVRDNFSVRMNTIFKMYYQAWILLSMASAYAFYALISAAPRLRLDRPAVATPDVYVRALIVTPIMVIGVGAGLLYPYYAVQSRYLHEDVGRYDIRTAENPTRDEPPLTLDGETTLTRRNNNPDELKTIWCVLETLGRKTDVILLEAPFDGKGYWAAEPPFSRFSAWTGIPTLLGWGNHEGQWRGEEYGTLDNGAGASQRARDADTLYTTTDWLTAERLIDQYGIDYVVVGAIERYKYGEQRGLNKFGDLFTPVCQFGQTAIYEVGGE